ncbi:MAG: cobyric acid synthase [Alphaproteobacteria bacterium]|jgi:adenosylcobyric acid synthase|nr:cobyric acid synthase [Alphaproteobacteria bacterium]
MTARTLMLQGTGSDVGKSLLVAGLCRIAARRGIAVRPFKPQNMSNNAAVTVDGGEIGRAQALQARAAGVEPTVHMNPVLLKPESETGAQIVVQGRMRGHAKAGAYQAMKAELLGAVLESHEHLKAEADLVIVEGAGSPAEINLRAGDIANMGFAEAADVPVVLIGDIDRGGVIASLVGTKAVMSDGDAARVAGFIVNKFRGDLSLFDGGVTEITRRTGWPCFGVAPWFAEANKLPAEDAVALRDMSTSTKDGIKVAMPMLARIANFDDLDPLRLEPGVGVQVIEPGHAIPGDVDLVLLPGSKSTIGDLAFLRAQGWDIDIHAHVRRGGRVLGLCGGYQMLGNRITDPEGIEGPPASIDGLGLLNVETILGGTKTLTRVTGRDLVHGEAIKGYEIHIGRTEGPDCARPLVEIGSDDGETAKPDGARSADGLVAGCYVHGLFAADGYRRAVLQALGGQGAEDLRFDDAVEQVLDRLADHLEAHLDIARLFALAR